MKRRWVNLAMVFAIAAWSQVFATSVTFNVNMSVQDEEGIFDPENDQVVVRGTFNNWGGDTHLLSDQGQGIYSGTFDIPEGAIQYKFVIPPDGWEGIPDNRAATVGTAPLNIPVVWFANDSVYTPPPEQTDVEVLFRVNMSIQQSTGRFDPATDWVVVRGAHDSLGPWGGAVRLTEEALNPGIYSRRIQFPQIGENVRLEYKFVYLQSGAVDSAQWEQLTGYPNGNRGFTPTGEEPDNFPQGGNGYGEINPDVVYYGDTGPDQIITRDLTVIFSVEDTPLLGRIAAVGYVVDVQSGTDTVRVVNVINFAGDFLTPAWPWGNFPPEANMLDNGVAPDLAAGDHVWTGQFLFPAGSPRNLIYKYGANGYDNEAGFARNHEHRLDDTEATYRMSIDCWGSPDTLFSQWACVISAADDERPAAVKSFQLEQNFPNPFNPTTRISFALNRSENVQLKVTDLTGREVSVTDLGRMEAGRHVVGFDGRDIATGIYFYTLVTPSQSETKKMLLLK